MGQTAVATLSGGLDSTTALRACIEHGWDIKAAVSFNYGQRHKKELEYAARTCALLDIKHVIIDLHAAGLTDALAPSRSSLVSDNDVPDGHYAEETMRQTIVPNRNMIMISIAAGIAIAEGAEAVVAAVHAGDHFIYPDCRPEFMGFLAPALVVGNEGFGFNGLVLPFLNATKADIAYEAIILGYDLSSTWSCYKGGVIHCGRCGTCVERLEAIEEAARRYIVEIAGPDAILEGSYYGGEFDNTIYEDVDFWKEAVANAQSR